MSTHDIIMLEKIVDGEVDIAELPRGYRAQHPSIYTAAFRRYRYFRHDHDCVEYVKVLDILLDEICVQSRNGRSAEPFIDIYLNKCWDSIKNIGYPNFENLSVAAVGQLRTRSIEKLKEACSIDAKHIVLFGEAYRAP